MVSRVFLRLLFYKPFNLSKTTKSRKKSSSARHFVGRLRSLKLPAWMLNRYVVVSVVFFIFITFIDSFNILDRLSLQKELRNAQSDLDYYQSEIQEVTRQLDELMQDDRRAEKFARERYLMKHSNEDVFVIQKYER